MTDAVETRARLNEGPRWVAAARLALGLTQGLALYLIVRDVMKEDASWFADRPGLLAPVLLTLAYLPPVLLAGLGRIRLPVLAVWAAVAGAVVWMMGWWMVERSRVEETETLVTGGGESVFLVLPFAAVALFVGHNLVAAAERARRPVGPYPDYFELAWKHGVQLALSIAFTGAVWLVLALGTALFGIIGLDFLQKLVVKPWFNIPVTTLAFALAVQLTDVREALIRGVRSVALMLLSWLLILMTILAAGFVLALPFTGLKGLWETGSATALVLFAAASLVILINAAYQDGRPESLPPVVLRWTARVAAGVLTPLILIAVYGLALRIGQHGLTPDRIIAAAFALVGAVYAGGYGFGAVRPGGWLKALEPTNVANAALAFVLIVLLSSPVLDPTRLSVMDQVARLERGAVTAARFDYRFLRWEGGKAGILALKRLSNSGEAEVARRARAALEETARWNGEEDVSLVTPKVRFIPAGVEAPQGFIVPVPGRDPRANCNPAGCEALVRDLDGDGVPDVLLQGLHGARSLFQRQSDGSWKPVGLYQPPAPCDGKGLNPSDRLPSLKTAPPSAWPDLVDDEGGRWRFGKPPCGDWEKPASASPPPAR